jgi:S1-C subfamily serine protease
MRTDLASLSAVNPPRNARPVSGFQRLVWRPSTSTSAVGDARGDLHRSDMLKLGKALALALLLGQSPGAQALTQDENNVIKMFQRNKSSVVFITNLTLRRDAYTTNQMEIPQGAGSGIVWDDQGHIVTNFHVVRGSNELMVKLNEGEESAATIVGVDEDKDIAVLKLNSPIKGMRPVVLAKSADRLQVGQSTYAIGNPFGLDHTLTSGIISGLGREISSQATGRPITDVIQTDCSINPGNSGGPLLSSDGVVIGINTAIYSSTGMSGGVGFAINIDTVKNSVQQILSNGRVRRPLMGIQFAPDMSVEMLGIEGVLVISAKQGSPAEKAGIKGTERDDFGRLILGDIITGVSGTPIKQSTDLFRLLNRKSVGDTLDVEILRGDEIIHVEVVLEDGEPEIDK